MPGEHSHLFLSDQDIADLGLTTLEIADSIEAALSKGASGTLWSAPKAVVQPGDGRYMMTTLSASDEPGVIVVKCVALNPRNPGQGLETINGTILVMDSETGLLNCVMEANWVTAVRTAGLSVVAARRLADPQARSVAFIGCGVQARSHLEAFADIFPLTEIRTFGRGRANIEKLNTLAQARGMTAVDCATPEEAIAPADIVVTSITATFDGDPFLDAGWMKPGAFAAITDLGKPWKPAAMGAFATVLIDDREQERVTPTPMIATDLVAADLTEAISGCIPVGFDPDKRSAFVFRGLAAGDFAVAALAYHRARNG